MLSALNAQIGEIEYKIPNHDVYITTPKFNRLKSDDLSQEVKLLSTKHYIFSLGRMYVTGNDGLQSILFISQRVVSYSHKKTNALIMLLLGTQKVYIALLFLHNIPILSIDFWDIKLQQNLIKISLVEERNKYPVKIFNADTVYELDTWSQNPQFYLKKITCFV